MSRLVDISRSSCIDARSNDTPDVNSPSVLDVAISTHTTSNTPRIFTPVHDIGISTTAGIVYTNSNICIPIPLCSNVPPVVPSTCPCVSWPPIEWPCGELQQTYNITLEGEEWSGLCPWPYTLIADVSAGVSPCTWTNPTATIVTLQGGTWFPYTVNLTLQLTTATGDPGTPAWQVSLGNLCGVGNFFEKYIGATPVGEYVNINTSEGGANVQESIAMMRAASSVPQLNSNTCIPVPLCTGISEPPDVICPDRSELSTYTYLGFTDESIAPPQPTWFRDYHYDGTCKRCIQFNTAYDAQSDEYIINSSSNYAPSTNNRDLETLIRDFVISINEEALFKQTATILFRISFFAWFAYEEIDGEFKRRMQEASDTAYKVYYKII